jgi:hypothetical protein
MNNRLRTILRSILHVTVCAFFCAAFASAQVPQRLWSQSFVDFHNALLYDRENHELIVHRDATVFRLDTRTNTVNDSYTLDGQTLAPFHVFNDTLLVTARQFEIRMFNLRTGSPIEVPDSLKRRYRFVDKNSHAGVYEDWPDTVSHVLVIVDLESLRVIATIPYSSVQVLAIDKVNGYLLGRDDGYIVRLSEGDEVDTIKGLRPADTFNVSAVVLSNGDILILAGDDGLQSGPQLHLIDGQQLEIIRSRRLNGPNGPYHALHLLDDERVVVHHMQDSASVVDVETLETLRVIHVSDSESLNLLSNRGMPIIALVDGSAVAFSDDLSTKERIWNDRSQIGDVAQLADGRVVVSTRFEPLHELNVLTGERTTKIWGREKPNSVRSATTILPSRSGPWVALGDGNTRATIISVNSDEVRCELVGKDLFHGNSTEYIELNIEWMDDDAEASICSFMASTPGPYFAGIHAFPAPCRDTSVLPTQGPIIYAGYGVERPPAVRTVVNADASITMIPVRPSAHQLEGQEVRVLYNVFDGQVGKDDYVSISDANHPLFTADESYGVVDHAAGLLRFDPRDPADASTHHVIDRGTRLIPMATIPGTNVVIVHDSAASALIGINVVSDELAWEIPITLRPHRVVVDRNARWMLLHDKNFTLEMYALDTAVSVTESGWKGAPISHSMYPNPASSQIHISPSDDVSYHLMNTLGEIVAEGKGATVSLASVSTGTYFLRVVRGNTTEVHSVVVQR